MPREIQLRLATDADAFEIAALSRDLIETGLGWSWTPARVLRSIESPETTVLVADIRGRVAAFAIMHFGNEEAHLNLLAVRNNAQRTGLGRRLVEWLEASALVAGTPIIYLQVRANNRGAQKFYEKLGYGKIAHVPAYYSGRESAFYMARDLAYSTSINAGEKR
jgi:[ribosomal protein S18]-alanine N-acetyltransferase